MPNHVVHWVQPDPDSVASWEFQYSPNGLVWYWVQNVEPVDDCANCFQAELSIPDQTMSIRSRAIGVDGGSSEWSNVIYMAEPSVSSAMAVALIVLVLMKRWRGR